MSIDVSYYSYSRKRADARWDNVISDIDNQKIDTEEYLYGEKIDSTFTVYPKVLDIAVVREEEVLYELERMDLAYGLVSTQPITDNQGLAYPICEALAEALGVSLDGEAFSKKQLLLLYQNIDTNLISKAADLLISQPGMKNMIMQEAKQLILDFIVDVRPIALDLKENEESNLIVEIDNEFCRDEMRQLVSDRARVHLETYFKSS